MAVARGRGGNERRDTIAGNIVDNGFAVFHQHPDDFHVALFGGNGERRDARVVLFVHVDVGVHERADTVHIADFNCAHEGCVVHVFGSGAGTVAQRGAFVLFLFGAKHGAAVNVAGDLRGLFGNGVRGGAGLSFTQHYAFVPCVIVAALGRCVLRAKRGRGQS